MCLEYFAGVRNYCLRLTSEFCRCLGQQENLACVSPVCFAGVWSNRRSGPVSHICVVQVFGATGEAGQCLTWVFLAGVWSNRRSGPVSHICVVQVFGATGEAGLCLTGVLCRCLEQQEKRACVSPVSFAGVWGNRRSGPVSHLCVLQVFEATGEVGLCLTCVLCRCLEQQEKRACVSPVCCHGCSEQQEKLMVCC